MLQMCSLRRVGAGFDLRFQNIDQIPNLGLRIFCLLARRCIGAIYVTVSFDRIVALSLSREADGGIRGT
jgi:hypothetical protein